MISVRDRVLQKLKSKNTLFGINLQNENTHLYGQESCKCKNRNEVTSELRKRVQETKNNLTQNSDYTPTKGKRNILN